LGEKILSFLEAFGLTEYESKIYAALILRGMATANELSDISGVPYTRIYDALKSLETIGLVVKIPSRLMRFKSIHPSIAIKNLKIKIKDKYERKMRELESLESELLKETAYLYEKTSSRLIEDIQVIKGRIVFTV